jgi:hypothetical protein
MSAADTPVSRSESRRFLLADIPIVRHWPCGRIAGGNLVSVHHKTGLGLPAVAEFCVRVDIHFLATHLRGDALSRVRQMSEG